MLLFLLILLVLLVFIAPRVLGRPRRPFLRRQALHRWLWRRHWL